MLRMTGAILGLLLASTTAPSGAEPPAPEAPVSLSSYWRYWVTVRPPVTSEPWVDKKGRKFTELSLSRSMWGGMSSEHAGAWARSITTADPPANWEAAGFDDNAWPVQRVPVCTGAPPTVLNFFDKPLNVRRLAGRIRFEVQDLAAVKSLKLSVAYRGGIVVYLNGEEVARQHVASGTLQPGDFAEGYAQGAYLPADADEAKLGAKMTYFGMWTDTIHYGWSDNPKMKALAEKVRSLRYRALGSLEIPVKLLRKGVNVLALDTRQAAISPAAHNWYWYPDPASSTYWPHLWVDSLRLTAEPAGVLRATGRPPGTQLWGEDIHRWVFNADFLEPGVKARPVEIVAARGGQFSGQAVIGSTGALANLTARVSDLTGNTGSKLPATAIRVRYGVPITLPMIENYSKGAMHSAFPERAIHRYAESLGLGRELAAAGNRERVLLLAGATKLAFFDHLSAVPPAVVPANSSQTIWLTVSVPKDTAPGEYCGKLFVRAGAQPENSLDVKVTVTGFTLAASQEWITFVGIEESPYSLAKGYSLILWSEEHWKRVAECLAWLGGLGNNLVQVPLACGMELGNAESMTVWVKKGNGYEYDWTVLDRFLGLARKSYAKPLALVAQIHPAAGAKIVVTVSEGGARRPLELPAPGTPEFNTLWLPFAKAFVTHLREKQLADSIHWGLFYDQAPPTLQALAADLANELPDVGWLRSSHDGFRVPPFPKSSKARVTLDAHIRNFSEPDWIKGGVGRKGWSRTDLNVLYPREAGVVTAVPGYPPLWHLRELPELAITSDARGFSRVGANYWDRTAGGWYVPGLLYILYPGTSGVEGSVQYEMLREGLQECEARIALEKKDAEAAILKERTGAAWLLPGGTGNTRFGEFYGGWQERSRRLYEAAGK